ncbi:MAG: GH92 family glycosyl hydrolase [Phycisphaerae bacterium]|nr:GH92 family glycosyl hydrolase [Phycisphaerae bacterium]
MTTGRNVGNLLPEDYVSMPIDNVDLSIGTAGDHGQLYPAAEMPFGLVKLAPDTYPGAATGSAHTGYDHDDHRILGFSHLRFSGVGNRGVGGNVLLLPTTRPDDLAPEHHGLPCDKASEQCSPGYYAVTLDEPGIRAELTATEHTGMHRYTFPNGTSPCVRIDLGRGFTPVRDVHCTVLGRQEIVGELTSNQMSSSGWYRIFFCIRFDRRFEAIRFHPDHPRERHHRSSDADGSLIAVARFDGTGSKPLLITVGLSSISVEQARRNIDDEAPDWDFERLRERCRQAWADVLGRIDVAGPREYRTLFYTHLYRACLSPFHVTTRQGTFMGDDGEVHLADGWTHYNGWSNWDTYCTKFPLLTLTEPVRMRDMMQSLTVTLAQRLRCVPGEAVFDHHGFVPIPTVRYELSNTILLDAYRKGIRSLDPEATYAVMRDVAALQFAGDRERLGYVPRRPDLTCEYAYDNWAAAEMARELGRSEDAARFDRRAAFYRNVWDPDLKFHRARDEAGDWLDVPDDLTVVDEKYVYEGSMWHWRWCVVHDVKDVVRLMGGREAFIKELSYFFENDLHNHGNEPGIHAPWMFAAVGAPWLSQTWVRRVLTEPMVQRYGTHDFLPQPFHGRIYRSEPEGFIPEMDDDDGCMTAWYVLSSMGLFPICVGRPIYALGTPLFEEVVLHNETGSDLRIVTRGFADDAWYIRSASLNGKPIERPWITHREIVEGGTLEFEASSEPNTSWGATDDLPW